MLKTVVTRSSVCRILDMVLKETLGLSCQAVHSNAVLLSLGIALSMLLVLLWSSNCFRGTVWLRTSSTDLIVKNMRYITNIQNLSEHHQVAALLRDLFHQDGAGTWPPRANHNELTWPLALRPYKEVYMLMASLLPQVTPSHDQEVNLERINVFRSKFSDLLRLQVNLSDVRLLLEAADAGRWDVFPRDVFNAYYCCLAASRHAYRWGTVPIVKVAQLEKEVDLPIELKEPWMHLQRHFGCESDSGNNMSNLVLNFDIQNRYMYKINTGMSEVLTSGEETFVRIFHDVEMLAVSIYHDMTLAIISFTKGDKAACAGYISSISAQLRFVLLVYFNNLHDKMVPRAIWLSHIQGFYGWGIGPYDDATGEQIAFNGLSGNQALLFQALDAFLGLEQYLSTVDQERSVPSRQRAFIKSLSKHSFRHELSSAPTNEHEVQIVQDVEAILKRLRAFRHTHRLRSKQYLSQPAPERVPMTAGKSFLGDSNDDSLEMLDKFMIGRIEQTV